MVIEKPWLLRITLISFNAVVVVKSVVDLHIYSMIIIKIHIT